MQLCYKVTIKRHSSPKHFPEVTERKECFQQNALDKLRFSDTDSKQVWQSFFLLKLKTITTCFEHGSFHNNLKDNVYGQVYSYKCCRLLPIQESAIEFFVGIISPPKILRNCPWQSHSFNITQDISLHPRTLLNPVTDDSMKVFKYLRQKLQEISEKRMQQSSLLIQLHEYSPQPTTGLKTVSQIHSGSAQKGKNILKLRKFQNNLCDTVPFSLTLLPCSPETLASANTDFKKVFPLSVLKQIFARKRTIMKSFD